MITAYDIPYSPAVKSDWTTDPRRVWDALEEMSARMTALDPPSGTDNRVVRMDGPDGLQDSQLSISDAGVLTTFTESASAGHGFTVHSDTAAKFVALELKKTRGSRLSPTAVESGNVLGGISWWGYGATGEQQTALMRAVATQAFTDSAFGTKLEFGTVPDDGTALALHLTIDQDGTFDFKTRRLTNFAGARETFVFAFGNPSTATLAATFYTAATTFMGTSAKRGARMMRPGSITKIHIVCDVDVVGTGDTLEGRVLKNFVAVFAAEISGLTVANGLEGDASQAVGVDTFVAGDYLSGRRVLTGASPGQVTTDDFRITIEVEYD